MSSDETFPLTLGGHTWQLPAMPFRIVKKAQPRLLALGSAVPDGSALLRLDEAKLDEFAAIAHLVVSFVEPEMTIEKFLELPFTVNELMLSFPAIARAIGLRTGATAAEAATPAGE